MLELTLGPKVEFGSNSTTQIKTPFVSLYQMLQVPLTMP